MAADSSTQDKSLPASQRKLDKARADGRVPRSRDLGHFAAVAGGGAALVALAPLAFFSLKEALARSLRFDGARALGSEAMAEQLLGWTTKSLWIVVPLGLAMIGFAIASALAVGGWTWTFKPLGPKIDALNPVSGLGRVFAREQVIGALKASLLAVVLGGIGAFWLARHVGEFVGVLAMPLPAAIASAAQTLAAGMGLIVVALAGFALADVPLQKRLYAARLRMSHQELKQEHKELEGNAEVKSKVRTRRRETTKRRVIAAVAKLTSSS